MFAGGPQKVCAEVDDFAVWVVEIRAHLVLVLVLFILAIHRLRKAEQLRPASAGGLVLALYKLR